MSANASSSDSPLPDEREVGADAAEVAAAEDDPVEAQRWPRPSEDESCGRSGRAACRSRRRRGSPARSPGGRTGTRSGRGRAAAGRGRASRAARCRARERTGSTQTCWIWTALGVHADASALKRIDAVLDPQPRPALLDLAARAPAEPVRVLRERIDPDLLLVRRRAGRQQQAVVLEPRRPEAGLARLGRVVDRVDGLAGPVVARLGHPVADRVPQLVDGRLVPDHHPARCRAARARRTRRSRRRPGRRWRRRGRGRSARRRPAPPRSVRAPGARRPRGGPAPPGPRAQNVRIWSRSGTVSTRSS